MALAAALHKGATHKITEGPLEGELITIIDPKAVPNGQPNQRKVLIQVGNEQMYLLPRQISDEPINTAVSQRPQVVTTPALPAPTTQAVQPVETAPVVHVIEDYVPITDPMDNRLDHLRPSRAKVRQYVNRLMPGGMTDVDFLLMFTNDEYREENQGRPANIMLKGDTQGGKTFIVEVLAVVWADRMGFHKPMPIFTLSGSSGITDYDLYGQPSPYYDPQTGSEHIVWLPGMVDMWARVGGILYLDECNAISERVTTSLHPVADHRHTFTNRNKPVKVPGDGFMPETVETRLDCWMIGTFNEGYRGMSDMNEAFINRFRHIEWGYDKQVELALVASPAIHLLADGLRLSRMNSNIRTPVGTAAMQRLALDVKNLGPALALEVFTSAFKANERKMVRQVITDRSIDTMLNEEVRTANLAAMGV